MATVVLGSASIAGARPNSAEISWETIGIRDEPPASRIASSCVPSMAADCSARCSVSMVWSRSGRIISSNSARVSRTRCRTLRHLHATDFEFLEAFSEYGAARASGLNAIAVLSRADEIGGGRLDALMSARRVAARYRSDPRLLGLCQDVVAVAGLLAQTAVRAAPPPAGNT